MSAAVSIKGVSKGFNNTPLYNDLNLAVLRGERIAIIGPNGSGKTTLLRMLAGEIEPDAGEMSLGHGVNMGYFAQHHSDMLDSKKTVIQEVYSTVPDATVGFIRNVCGAFLFSGEDVDKVIGVLSGGEKLGRLAGGRHCPVRRHPIRHCPVRHCPVRLHCPPCRW